MGVRVPGEKMVIIEKKNIRLTSRWSVSVDICEVKV